MSISLPGYKSIEAICEDVSTVIYRATRESDGISVLIKSLKVEYPTLEELARLRHEYKILQPLKIEGVVKSSDLINYQNGLLLFLEDFGGDPFSKIYARQKLDICQWLQIGIQLSETLAQLHRNNIIHKNLKSPNIFINPATGQVKITDFSIATRLVRENQTLSHPNLLEGTLAYMSPEQTGRMNRAIDYRSDFYSLGVTFYEMLTGILPFHATDPLGLVHCHIAKIPVSPSEINPEIPPAISSIVMKLLAKTAEDRYQSAQGLKADLEQCMKRLRSPLIAEKFIPGQQDSFSQFVIPQKLYGREAEVASLMAAFGRVASPSDDTACEMMLVSGYSGIGKTSVVNEVHKPIVRERGYFVAGKFDQFKRNIPYAAIAQALQELMRQILTESPENMAIWKSQILEALGSNAGAIANVIPEVELIIGKQPELPSCGAIESQNRFNRAFQQFLRACAKPERPLAIFLDDLQWADSASLKLIELLLCDRDCQYLLLIGAYRDNEVDATHPLMRALDEIRSQGARVNTITLSPLHIRHVSQLVADTLHDETSRVKPLVELVFNKTQGNPFFLTQLLQTLHQENLLTFDFETGAWQWSLEQIQAIGITDYNVVELIARNIQKLPETTQKVLKLAACIGDKFNLEILSIVNETSQSETANDLWEGLQAGLILPLNKSYKIPLVFEEETLAEKVFDFLKVGYKFLHDRVQQAAYFLIPESQKKETHIRIGKLLLKHSPKEKIEENIFEIVNQLNIGLEFTSGREDRKQLASLNLMAGRKAKAAIAYEPAIRYLNVGLELLGENSWQSDYDVALNLHIEAAEAHYLNTQFERAEILAEIVLQRATGLLDKVRGYEVKMQSHFSKHKMEEAIETGLSVLEMLGFPTESITSHTGVELPSLGDLENMPEMTDPYQLAAMRILMAIASYAYSGKPQLYPQLILTMVNLCIKCGHSPLSAYAYGQYGVILCGKVEGIETGYRSGQLALKLLEMFPAKEHRSKIYQLFNVFIRHFKEPIRETIAPLQDALESALETGDLEYAGYAAFNYGVHLFLTGSRLDAIDFKQEQFIEVLRKIKQQFPLGTAKIWRQLFLNLLGKAEDKYRLRGESFDEDEMANWQSSSHFIWLFNAYFLKMILANLLKKPEIAVENGKLSAIHAEASGGWIVAPAHNFYYSLSLLAQYENVGIDERQEYLNQVEANQEKMQQWARHAPMNYQHKYELVEAEKARVLNDVLKAMEYYDRAIAGARDRGYVHELAIAEELAAEFYLACGREKVAKTYMTEAYYAYERWGCTLKVRDLEERYPQLFSTLLLRDTAAIEMTRTITLTTGGSSAALDLSTVLKATRAISGEIVLDKLLDKLMNILMENAGARRGFLLLERAGKWVLVAEGNVEKDFCELLPFIPIENYSERLPLAAINYVERTHLTVVLNEATGEGIFAEDSYIVEKQPKSVLCLPIIYQGKLNAILYLENNLTKGAFTQERLEVLNLLSAQAAISLENAILYQELQTYSQKLDRKNAELVTINESLQAEIASRVRVEEERLQLLKQLEIERGQLEAVLQQMPAGAIVVQAPSGKLILCNEQVAQIWRRSFAEFENIAQDWDVKGFHPDGRLYSRSEWPLERSMATGEVAIAEEIGILRGDGTVGTLSVSSAPIRNSAGQIVAGVVTFHDITENKEAEHKLRASLKEKEVLLKEIHHRVKNNLQIISSLLNLQSGYIKDKQVLEIFKDSENRVATMALIHEQLYQSKNLATIDFAEYIQNLIANLLSSYEVSSQGIEVEINISNILLNIDAAVPCGLIINELVLNSMKHAFSMGEAGKISVDIDLKNEEEYQLIVSDNGIGFPENLDFKNTQTLGLQLVNALTNQLEGSITLNRDKGTQFQIFFPRFK